MASLLPTPEPADPVEGQPGHFAHSNWVKASVKALDAGTVQKAGDTMTGDLSLTNPPTVSAHVANKGYVDLVRDTARAQLGAGDPTLSSLTVTENYQQVMVSPPVGAEHMGPGIILCHAHFLVVNGPAGKYESKMSLINQGNGSVLKEYSVVEQSPGGIFTIQHEGVTTVTPGTGIIFKVEVKGPGGTIYPDSTTNSGWIISIPMRAS